MINDRKPEKTQPEETGERGSKNPRNRKSPEETADIEDFRLMIVDCESWRCSGPRETGKSREERNMKMTTTDKNVKLPKQVQKMMEGGDGKPSLEAPVAEAPVAEAPAGVLDIPAVKPEVKPGEEAPKVPETVRTPNYEQMYNTLKGKYDAEVPALLTQNRLLREELDNRPATAVQPGSDLSAALSEEELEELGPEGVSATAKMIQQAREESAAELQMLRRQAFIGTLTGLCPKVAVVNEDPAFHAWLNEPIPMTGQTRFAVLRAANEAMDAVRCAEVFNAYLAEAGDGVLKHDLSALAVPRPVTGGEGKPAEKPVYTESQVRAFYEDLTKGHYRNNSEKAVQMEADINAAAAEGRIIKG